MAVKYQDYYETLGVGRTASPEEIRKAYRTLARKHHPDVSKDPKSDETFKRINEAYEVLKDPEKRRRYDALGANWKAGQEFRPPPGFEGFQFHFGQGGQGGGFAGDAGGFSEFFESLFGQAFAAGAGAGGRPRAGRRRAASPFADFASGGFEAGPGAFAGDMEAEIDVPLETVIHGGLFNVRLSDPRTGTPRSYEVRIPAGIAEGKKVRLAGQGDGGGDLFLKVRYGKDARFVAEGADLVTDVRVAPWEAALGAKVPVATLDGTITLTIPAGSSSGRRMRIKGHGLPKSGGGRGDLFARVMVAVPESLSPRERELMEELAKASAFKPRG